MACECRTRFIFAVCVDFGHAANVPHCTAFFIRICVLFYRLSDSIATLLLKYGHKIGHAWRILAFAELECIGDHDRLPPTHSEISQISKCPKLSLGIRHMQNGKRASPRLLAPDHNTRCVPPIESVTLFFRMLYLLVRALRKGD